MLPYTLLKHDNKQIYLHGIVHPNPIYKLHQDYRAMIKREVEEGIQKGEKWYGEYGIGQLFNIEGLIGIEEFNMNELTRQAEIPKSKLALFVLKGLISYAIGQFNKPKATLIRTIEDLVRYRATYVMSQVSQGLIYRCKIEVEALYADASTEIHFLSGLLHEKIITQQHGSELVNLLV
ncbi:MAG: hypothetical protein AABW92_03750 [Nanoarchaeota archaeon]